MRRNLSACTSIQFRMVLLLATAFLSAGQAAGQTQPARINWDLPEVAWQPIPATQLAYLYVGPDNRVWAVLHKRPKMDVGAIKAMIEAEWRQPNPQIALVRPALFEPLSSGGRVWFTYCPGAGDGKLLLGYDGKQWIEHAAPIDASYNGVCPGHAQEPHEGNNAYAGGHAFFVCQNCVEVFDGTEWTSHTFWKKEKATQPYYAAKLYREPDGRGVVALAPLGDDHVQRWREGKWSVIPLPKGARGPLVRRIAVVSDGLFLLTLQGGLLRLKYGDADEVVNPTTLLKQLVNSDEKKSADALEELTPMAGFLKERVQAQINETEDTAAKSKLQRLLATSGRGSAVARVSSSQFGPYTLGSPIFLFGDCHGHVLTGSLEVDGNDLNKRAALLIFDESAGRFSALPGEATLARFTNPRVFIGYDSGPLVVNDGESIWLSGDRQKVPASLLNLKTLQFTAECPVAEYCYLLAAKPNGTLFVARKDVPGAAWMMFRPGAKDNAAVLKPTSIIKAGPAMCVNDDGTIVAVDSEGRLIKFDGKQWDFVPRPDDAPKIQSLGQLIAGKGGAVLAAADNRGAETPWALLTSTGEEFDAKGLSELVEQQHARLIESFAGAQMDGYVGREPALAFDKSGNIWLAQRPKMHLQIYLASEKRWIDATETVKASRMRRGYVVFMASIGDGDRVYLSDFGMRHDGGNSLIGQIKDGKLSLTPAPHCMSENDMPRPVRELSGDALWVAGTTGQAGGGSDIVTGQQSCRITRDGEITQFAGTRPVFSDRSGNAWLVSTSWNSPASLTLWHEGRIVPAPAVASLDKNTRFLSDRPGSVFIWSGSGVAHLIEDEAHRGTFKQQQMYAPQGISESVRDVRYSALGYFVVLTETGYPGSIYRIYLIPIPT